MRKLFPLFLIIPAILFTLSACQNTTKETAAPAIEVASTATPRPTNTPEPTPTPSPTPDAETVAQNSAVAMSELERMTQMQVSLLNTAVLSNTQTQTCDYEQPANAYCRITAVLVPPGSTRPLENKYEILFLDGEAWTREDGP